MTRSHLDRLVAIVRRTMPVRAVAMSLAMLTAAGCAGIAQPHSALRVPADQFREQVKTLCFLGTNTDVTFDDFEARMSALEELFVDQLERSGFTIVPEERVVEAWREVSADVGDLHDRYTGQFNRDRWVVARQRAIEQLDCDGYAKGRVAQVRVPFNDTKAKWDGVEVAIGGIGRTYGWVTGLSFWAILEDAEGEELYFSTGGIQVLSRVVMKGLFSEGFEDIDPSGLLSDEGANERAISEALRGLRRPQVNPGG